MMDKKPLIYNFNLEELSEVINSWGEPSYRAVQIWQGLYRQYWGTPEEFSNLPKSLREKIEDNFSFSHLGVVREVTSKDDLTIKTLFKLPDNQGVEAVLMHYPQTGSRTTERNTLCISTQVGCAMACVFCATGQMGFKSNLSSGEIVEQVLFFARQLKSRSLRVTNIVVMGMGEPFNNYDATMAAIDRLNHPEGFNLGARRFTISTIGLVPFIKRFALEHRQVNLAISLHAADDESRSKITPINRWYPLDTLIQASRDYVKQTHRRITFEWALIDDVNDSLDTAKKLSSLLDGLLCHVNLIPLNPTSGYSEKPTSRKRALAFQSELQKNSIPCTIRVRRGIEIQAGCGQLAIEGAST